MIKFWYRTRVAQNLQFSYWPFPARYKRRPLANHVKENVSTEVADKHHAVRVLI